MVRASLLLVPIFAAACSKSGIYPLDDDTAVTSACRAAAPGCGSETTPDSDVPPDPIATGDTASPAAAWAHTITVDGDVGDWTADESLATTSGDAWVTWDATDLFVAVRHPDVSAGTALHWVVVYVGSGAGGTTTGASIGTQEPALPTGMSHAIRWKADGSYDDLLAWDGIAWVASPGWLGTEGSAKQESDANTVLELAIPRAAVGVGDLLDLHVAWVYEGAGSESTYAGSPATSFPDGAYDPDYAAYWRFDLSASPASATPLP